MVRMVTMVRTMKDKAEALHGDYGDNTAEAIHGDDEYNEGAEA